MRAGGWEGGRTRPAHSHAAPLQTPGLGGRTADTKDAATWARKGEWGGGGRAGDSSSQVALSTQLVQRPLSSVTDGRSPDRGQPPTPVTTAARPTEFGPGIPAHLLFRWRELFNTYTFTPFSSFTSLNRYYCILLFITPCRK